MDRFAELQTFIAVVEAGSFSAAAKRLGIAVSAVSRRMDELEDRLGVRLANRSSRGFAPTPLGLDYYNSSVRLLSDLAEADSTARGGAGELTGRVRIAAPINLPALAPALLQIAKSAPDLILDLDLNDRRVDLVGEGFDLAIRVGELQDSGLMARKLFDVNLIVCASPGYWKSRGKPEHPDQLKHHNILAYSGSRVGLTWRYRQPDGIEGIVKLKPRMVCNNGEVLLRAAKEGLGIVLEPDFICSAALDDGSVEACLNEFRFQFEAAAYVVYPPGRPLPTRVRYIIDRLVEEFRKPLPWERRGSEVQP